MKYNSRSDSVLLQAVSAEALGLLKGKELLPVWGGLCVVGGCCQCCGFE